MKENEKFVETAVKELGNTFEKYGLNDEWCARFVSWCAEKCNFIDKYFVFTDGAGSHAREGVSHKYGEFKLSLSTTFDIYIWLDGALADNSYKNLSFSGSITELEASIYKLRKTLMGDHWY